MTARCLFGVSDPAQNEKLLAKVYNAKKLTFERRWNFAVDTKSHVAPDLAPKNNYQWNESYDQDYMAKCDQHRFNISRVPVSHSVTLLSAPIIHDEFVEVADSAFSELPSLENDAAIVNESESSSPSHESGHGLSQRSTTAVYNINARNVVTTPKTTFSRIRKHSSSESLSYDTEVMSSPDDLVFTFPTVKQRCITDYMKIKKIPRVKKIR